MRTRHTRRQPTAYLWMETGAFFFFSVTLCALTFLGAAGVDPFSKSNALSNTTGVR